LSGRLPEYVIDLWISSMHTKYFDLLEVEPCDLIDFLNHIDQYPTDCLAVNPIEDQLINYLKVCVYPQVCDDQRLIDMAVKYKLRLLYLYLHLIKQ
jgi:hypothetical protein